MIKTILLCTDGSAHSNVACDYALDLTKQLDAKLTGLHVLDSRLLEGPLMADISGWIGAQPYGAQLQQFRELLQKRGEAVIEAFHKRCDAAGVGAEGTLKMGHPAKVILTEEAKSELVIIGQRGEHAALTEDLMGSNAERIVRNSAKRCMVTAATHRPLQKILAAFDGSAHSSQALHEAIELAKATSMELSVLTVAERGLTDEVRSIAGDAKRLAGAHDVKVATYLEEGDPVDTILEQAEALDSDLILVGAYGHGRIHEMILGSTTTQLIAQSDRAVMLVQ